jgi:hypothetical protein
VLLRWIRVAVPRRSAATRPTTKVMKKTLLTVPGWLEFLAVRLAPANRATSTIA